MSKQNVVRLVLVAVALFFFTVGYWCGRADRSSSNAVYAQQVAGDLGQPRNARNGGAFVYTSDSSGKLYVWEVHAGIGGANPTAVRLVKTGDMR